MTSAKYDVLGIGNAIFDILVQTDESFLAGHGMIKGGMSLIDEARAAYVGKVRDDQIGRLYTMTSAPRV